LKKQSLVRRDCFLFVGSAILSRTLFGERGKRPGESGERGKRPGESGERAGFRAASV